MAVRLELAAHDAHRPTLAAVAMRLAAVLDNPNAYTAYCAASARLAVARLDVGATEAG